ncbi:MAG TPA: helix-turn-helix domain-containing protein [Myxococcota bacterium]|nr:helix-turn-helix domain-containing protein [Myxococcota bacterium]
MDANRTEARPPKTAQGAASRERLLDAAIDLIAERGYSASSVEALCRRAGVAKTALYWHFGSKEGLLAAAMEKVANAWIEEIQKSVYLARDPAQRLERAFEGLRRMVEARPQILRLLLAVANERAEVAPETRQRLRAVFQRAEAALVQGIEDAVGRTLPDLDLVAHTTIGLVQAASLRLVLDPEETDLDRLFADLQRTFVLLVADRLSRAPRTGEPR